MNQSDYLTNRDLVNHYYKTNQSFKFHLNVDTTLTRYLDDSPKPDVMKYCSSSSLPSQWDWHRNTHYSLVSPQNQFSCGSCFAMACVTVIRDMYIIQKGFDPKLSPTYVLSQLVDHGCSGGNPGHVMKLAETQGIKHCSGKCGNYDWCSQNDSCNGLGQKHFETKTQEAIFMNNLIPKQCSCSKTYNIEHTHSASITPSTLNKAEEIQRYIKCHIYTYGPIVGTYHVLNNFTDGNYHTNGIYMEDIFYHGKGNDLVGDHAISILGWGEENVKLSPIEKRRMNLSFEGDSIPIPYWYCRNSWGESWNGDGYFKFAMYPFNKHSCMEMAVPLGQDLAGGVVLSRVSPVPGVHHIYKFYYTYLMFVLFVILISILIICHLLKREK